MLKMKYFTVKVNVIMQNTFFVIPYYHPIKTLKIIIVHAIYPKQLTVMQFIFYIWVAPAGIKPTTFGTASAILYRLTLYSVYL
jgi:hypothetical protein